MNEHLMFYKLSNEDSQKVLQQIEVFNQDRTDKNGVYAISLATELRPYYILWRVFSEQLFIPVRTLAVTFALSVERAMELLAYCDVSLQVFNSSFFEAYYSAGAAFIPFGKYRGKRLAEILYIEPSYILWMANKFSPDNSKFERIKEEAKRYATVYFELMVKQYRPSTQSEFVGEKGEKLYDFYITVANVRLQTDSYKPDFYVDQNVLALDENGNRYTFFVKAGGKSMTPNQLSCHSRIIHKHETLHVKSAKVMRHYAYHETNYTHLGYVKLEE